MDKFQMSRKSLTRIRAEYNNLELFEYPIRLSELD